MPHELVLAGDIGGTKTNLALFSARAEKLRCTELETYPSQRYAGLAPLVKEFLARHPVKVDTACFGIAGAVVDGKVKTPNLPWAIDAADLRAGLKFKSIALLNDLEATGFGIFTLEDSEFCTLNRGAARQSGSKALIAAGTGLGESILYENGDRFCPLASEGGHGDFAPRNELEIELLRHLINRFHHVSYERALSGPGLFNIYRFLKEEKKCPEPSWLAERLAQSGDPSAVISATALAGEAEICSQALTLFVSIYGAEAGNLALRAKSLRGLYIGGGIAPKILQKMRDGTFMKAFVDKGRYEDMLAAIPVQVILNEQAALRGAAYYAAFLCHD